MKLVVFLFIAVQISSIGQGAKLQTSCQSKMKFKLEIPTLPQIKVISSRTEISTKKLFDGLIPEMIALLKKENHGIVNTGLFQKSNVDLDEKLTSIAGRPMTLDSLFQYLSVRCQNISNAVRIYSSRSPPVLMGVFRLKTHGLKANSLNVALNMGKADVQNLNEIVNSNYGGSFYQAYIDNGLNVSEIFLRQESQGERSYSYSELVKKIRSFQVSKAPVDIDIQEAVASETVPKEAPLVRALLKVLFHSKVSSAAEIASNCSDILKKNIDQITVINQLKILGSNRTLLGYLKLS